MSSGDPILSCRKLVKTFPSGDRTIEVLTGVDFGLAQGESVSVRGESGSGKTTLLSVLAGLEEPDSGHLLWSGEDAFAMSSDAMARTRGGFIGLVFQAFYLIPELNAFENVLISRRMLGSLNRSYRERARMLLERVGLIKRLDHLPSQLSGGERQRVALARSLMNRPEVVLADEPTGNLDEATGNNVIDVLLRLCREDGVSLVLVTHNQEHAARADRQMLLHAGRLEKIGDETP
jgi:predicted ABC-type transport system involved in lysophospholipase L1 biosynthesis ATPase subunit